MNFPKVFVLTAIAATALFSTGEVFAAPGALNISATGTFEADATTETSATFKPVKKSFKTADALALLANATEASFGGDQSWFTAKGSKLVFDPDAYNPEASAEYGGQDVYGIFWVTNAAMQKIYRLDGVDDSTNYWSFVEFDFAPWILGFSAASELNLNGIHSGKYSESPYLYSDKIMGNATFYIHDYPYAYDYPDFLDLAASENDFSVVLTGVTTYSFSYKFDSSTGLYPSKNSFSLKGSGDGFWDDDTLVDPENPIWPVYSGTVKSSDSGKESFDVAPAPF